MSTRCRPDTQGIGNGSQQPPDPPPALPLPGSHLMRYHQTPARGAQQAPALGPATSKHSCVASQNLTPVHIAPQGVLLPGTEHRAEPAGRKDTDKKNSSAGRARTAPGGSPDRALTWRVGYPEDRLAARLGWEGHHPTFLGVDDAYSHYHGVKTPPSTTDRKSSSAGLKKAIVVASLLPHLLSSLI